MDNNKKESFFTRLLDLFFGGRSADALKKKQLKNINKKFLKTRYGKFYRKSGNEATPVMAKFIYDIYKTIYPARSLFQSIQNPNVLKRLIISYSLPKEIKQLEEELSEESIAAKSKELSLDKLKAYVKVISKKYADYFTLERIEEINGVYKLCTIMKDFCTFDFYFLLKKFDKNIKEGDVQSAPQFSRINAEYINEDLKDLITVIKTVPTDGDWTALFKIFKEYKGGEQIVNPKNWKRLLGTLQLLKMSGAFTMILQMSTDNPLLVLKEPEIQADITDEYVQKVRRTAEETVERLISENRELKSNDIAHQLFGDIEMQVLKYYTSSMNEIFAKKNVPSYIYEKPLNYVKLFLLEVMKKDMREYRDEVVVPGHWGAQSVRTAFSDAYDVLGNLSDTITKFDASVSDAGTIGVKVRGMLTKADRDPNSKDALRGIIKDANDEAYEYINNSLKNVVTVGKIIKSLIDDKKKAQSELISNWKEIDRLSGETIDDLAVSIYKKIYVFTSLIKTCFN